MEDQDKIKNLNAIKSLGVLIGGIFVAAYANLLLGENLFSGIFAVVFFVASMVAAYFIARNDGKKYAEEVLFTEKSKYSPFIIIGMMIIFVLAVVIPLALFPDDPSVGFYVFNGGGAALLGFFIWKATREKQYGIVFLVAGGLIGGVLIGTTGNNFLKPIISGYIFGVFAPWIVWKAKGMQKKANNKKIQ